MCVINIAFAFVVVCTIVFPQYHCGKVTHSSIIFCVVVFTHTHNTRELLTYTQCTSAQASIRAKLKHISQRSAKIETNQDSLSNGE